MKTSILVAIIVACGLSAPIVSAQEKPAPDNPAMNKDMDMDKHMGQMQEKMKAMQAQMDKIRNTTDPKERQKLMQEHMQAMQENMKAMHGMGGKKGDMKDGDMLKRHEMMGQRIDMMEMMIEQMMRRDQMKESMSAK